MKILAIETSCDETAIAILERADGQLHVRANIISSQVELHKEFGGVVPNLAGREHAKNILPVFDEALTEAGITPHDIDLIAITHGPGLIPALLVGVSAAKSFALYFDKPLLGIHHIEGHIYANWIETNTPPQFPLIGLIVSGGHTQITLMQDHCTYEIIGETQDDAVGEAFDKAARLLGLSYPGGPEISRCAQLYNSDTNKCDIELPRPMIHSGDYNFSFSGIKTAVLYKVRDYQKSILKEKCPNQKSFTKEEFDSISLPDEFVHAVAHAFQEAVTEVLVTKTVKAALEHGVQSVILAGGVSANTQLREALGSAVAEKLPHATYHIPQMAHCLDNAAMIAAAAYHRWQMMSDDQKEATKKGWHTVYANPNLKMHSYEKPQV